MVLNSLKLIQFAGFKRTVLKEIFHCQLKLNTLIKSVSLLLKAQKTTQLFNVVDKQHVMNQKLPVTTMTELEALEQWLMENDNNNYKIMLNEFGRVGGQTYQLATRKLLYKCLSNLVAMQYSWDGLKQKAAFKKLLLARCILDAIKSQFHNVSESDIVTVIKIWLVKAKERNAKAGTRGAEDADVE
ncbi:unnamed protein product [Ceutorhynchus assimilis]|uniref:DUF4806 domain-containing protein n=1 Tax=Ceutorhynchus assimilis TaxID=467358 RepID=A0A9P0DCK2_9CUCU|nr:unnamed protein product [Ceutorhynchus assimilis]